MALASILSRFFTLGKYSTFSILQVINKNKYVLLLLFSLLPTLLRTTKTMIETGNPLYPLIEIGLTITNADRALDILVDTLRNNPEEYIVPLSSGIGNFISHYWSIILTAWNVLGKIVLISFPFFILHKFIKVRNISEPAKNFTIVAVSGFIFLLLFNSFYTIYELGTGEADLKLQETDSLNEKIKNISLIILYILPFKGIINLILYLSGIEIPVFRV